MTDREMLEFAAKAAGLRVGFERDGKQRGRYDLYWSLVNCQLVWHDKIGGFEYPEQVFWSPLTDTGDAARLMIDLRLEPRWIDNSHSGGAEPSRVTLHNMAGIVETVGDDPRAAFCRAIVRAAAEIGRQMP